MNKERVKAVRAFSYITSIMWSAYLILTSYQQAGDLATAFITILVLLGSMILNDLIKLEK